MIHRPVLCCACVATVVAAGAAVAQRGPPPDPARRAEMIRKFDKDGDGKLSEAEMAAARQARSGSIRAGAGKGAVGATTAGAIANDEKMQRLFERFDGNADGKLDYGEMAALREAMRNRPEGARGAGK